jgi:hypothetical protein
VIRAAIVLLPLLSLALPAAAAAPSAPPPVATYVRVQGQRLSLSQAVPSDQLPPTGNVELVVSRPGARPLERALAVVDGRIKYVDRPAVTTVYSAWWKGPRQTTYATTLGVVYVRPRVALAVHGGRQLVASADPGTVGRERVLLQRCRTAAWRTIASARLTQGVARFGVARVAAGTFRAFLPVVSRPSFVAGFSRAVGRPSRCDPEPAGRLEIAARLERDGLPLEPLLAPQPSIVRFFSVAVSSYRTPLAIVSLYEFPDVKTAVHAAGGVGDDGRTVNERLPNGDVRVARGDAPLRWFRRGRMVAVYFGSSPSELAALQGALGRPFRSTSG